MSLRRKVSHFLALVVVAALAVGLMAGPASAKVSPKKKAQIQRQLRKAVKKNPRVVSKRWFLKRASLVNFKLPVTIRLRGSSSSSNPNNANLDLGASLGQREVDLGGKLAAEIVFHDSFDGGALGNVDVNILETNNKSLSSTSVPLLWNQQISQSGSSYDSNLLEFGGIDTRAGLDASGHKVGCSDVSAAGLAASAYAGVGNLPFGKGYLGTGAVGAPGVPIYPDLATAASHGTPLGFAPAHIASSNPDFSNYIQSLSANKALSGVASKDNDRVGGNPQPFPYSPDMTPDNTGSGNAFSEPPSPADTVLRTNALSLTIAHPGTEVTQTDGSANGPEGSQNIVIGKSGGQANLFGNIPGKGYGIDVTVNLATTINSIIRVNDQDAWAPLIAGQRWPAAVFSCAQIWTGGVQNYIPGVRLKGDLHISPAITSDGHLRIAKASLSGLGDPAHISLAACLAPYASYNAPQADGDTGAPPAVPTPDGTNSWTVGPLAGTGTLLSTALPADSNNMRPKPGVDCNTPPIGLVKYGSAAGTVGALQDALSGNGYTTTADGSRVSVAGDLTVKDVEADILVGDV